MVLWFYLQFQIPSADRNRPAFDITDLVHLYRADKETDPFQNFYQSSDWENMQIKILSIAQNGAIGK